MQKEALVENILVAIQMVDPKRVERTGPADDAVNGISFAEEELGKIASILAGDSGDKGDFGHDSGLKVHRLMRDTRCGMQDAGCGMQDSGYLASWIGAKPHILHRREAPHLASCIPFFNSGTKIKKNSPKFYGLMEMLWMKIRKS